MSSSRRGAVVDEDRDVDRLGRARDAQHLARDAVFADAKVIGAEAFDRLALLVDRADEHRAARAAGLGAWGVDERRSARQTRPRRDERSNSVKRMCV